MRLASGDGAVHHLIQSQELEPRYLSPNLSEDIKHARNKVSIS